MIPAYNAPPNIATKHEDAIAAVMHRMDKLRLRERRLPPDALAGKTPEETAAHKRAIQTRNRAQRLLDCAGLAIPFTRRSMSDALDIEDSSAGNRIQAMMRDGYVTAVRGEEGHRVMAGRAGQYVLTEAGKAELARLQGEGAA